MPCDHRNHDRISRPPRGPIEYRCGRRSSKSNRPWLDRVPMRSSIGDHLRGGPEAGSGMLMVWARASPSEAQQRCLERSPWASEEFRVPSRPLQLGVSGSPAERSSTPSTALRVRRASRTGVRRGGCSHTRRGCALAIAASPVSLELKGRELHGAPAPQSPVSLSLELKEQTPVSLSLQLKQRALHGAPAPQSPVSLSLESKERALHGAWPRWRRDGAPQSPVALSLELKLKKPELHRGWRRWRCEASCQHRGALADDSLEVQASPSEATADGRRMQEVADKERLVVEMLEMGAMAKTSPSSSVHLGT